jgi:hypothetical protein
MAVVKAPERQIVELPKNSRGLFAQPDWSKMSDREKQEFAAGMQKRRMRAAHDADFADEITGLANTNDPMGDYRCAVHALGLHDEAHQLLR